MNRYKIINNINICQLNYGAFDISWGAKPWYYIDVFFFYLSTLKFSLILLDSGGLVQIQVYGCLFFSSSVLRDGFEPLFLLSPFTLTNNIILIDVFILPVDDGIPSPKYNLCVPRRSHISFFFFCYLLLKESTKKNDMS